MNRNLALLDATARVQRRVSDPAVSAFVRANAGSGKTHVLIQRVLRLLLDGTLPSRILCLTYTKAAAANMATRVFGALAAWTALGDAELRREIVKTGAPLPDEQGLRLARVLFARAVETPGGLKIQTIHAFCDRVLHLFPFEANVPANFRQMEEAEQTAMLARAQTQSLANARTDPALARRLRVAAEAVSHQEFNKLLRDAVASRALLGDESGVHANEAAMHAGLSQRLGIAADATVETVWREIVEGGYRRAEWPALTAILMRGTNTERSRAEALVAAIDLPDATAALAYFKLFLTADLTPLDKPVSKPLQASHPHLHNGFAAEQQRLCGLVEMLRAAQTRERSSALYYVLRDILARYEAMKNAACLLDFDDLIARTLALVTRTQASWVLYKLDQGIDHILVDEAQDTSPRQWQIVEKLSAEFAAGAGARQGKRTIFAVGDEKQSIFSFQGAAPEEFARMRMRYAGRAHGEARFEDASLLHSFRSAAAIVKAVDCVFSVEANYRGLTAGDGGGGTVHANIRQDLRGLVELWPVVGPDPASPENGEAAPRLARRIAMLIAGWLSRESAERVIANADPGDDEKPGVPRRIRPGDVMILVRTRNAFFEAMIRALKHAGVPVAGADRLRVFQHIAVEDLVAAARVALLPEDDLTLATVLKSPLVGLDEDQLLHIAAGRRGSLWQALRDKAPLDARIAEALARLEQWRADAAAPPFTFFSALLGSQGGKRRLLARLGPEAEDAIEEFLNVALAWEKQNPATLAAFIHSLADDDLQIKRDLEGPGEAVRVMTVHGAKGLEAKIVILPDTCGVPDPRKLSRLHYLGSPPMLAVAAGKAEDCAVLRAARDAACRAADEEHRRLLYVALTRAEERLYIAGHANGELPDGSWYKMIEATLGATLQPEPAFWDSGDTVWRGVDPPPPGLRSSEVEAHASDHDAALPAWLEQRVADAGPAMPQFLRASGEAFDSQGDSRRGRALARGDRIHDLLSVLAALPPEARKQGGERLLASRNADLDASEARKLLDQALAVIALPELAALFGAGSQAEVELVGNVAFDDGQVEAVVGRVDRMALADGLVVYADFKSGAAPVGPPPLAYLLQLARYGAILGQIYPGKPRRALLVWTDSLRVDDVSGDVLAAALASHASRTAPASRQTTRP